jgi:hypothetical protein
MCVIHSREWGILNPQKKPFEKIAQKALIYVLGVRSSESLLLLNQKSDPVQQVDG